MRATEGGPGEGRAKEEGQRRRGKFLCRGMGGYDRGGQGGEGGQWRKGRRVRAWGGRAEEGGRAKDGG